ncbi:type II secretion system protein GspL [Ferrimonas balearica]|uniref:type II secretion system protein GspL n=1 Tax=Ferrimonas balearica TaxID=44012 RepID=UPI001C9908F7|nr:type II secretion system protein GspL [Ferrimonas balearica]MBY5994004.1 type II secretion system protein GspL [Ferrimonas balearica]
MSERLVIRLGSDAGQSIPWITWSEEQQTVISSGVLPGADGLSSLSERAGGRPVEVLVDSSALTLTEVTLPAKAQRQALKALPFMLEDELAQDVDQLHFVTGPREGDQLSVVAVPHGQLQRWLGWLEQAELPVKKIVPDVLALALVEETELSVLQLEQQLLVRSGAGSGMVLEPDWLALMADNLQGEGRPWALFTPLELPEGIEAAPQPLELPMQALAEGFVRTPVNLLTGAYAPAKELSKLVSTWTRVGIAAAVVLVLVLAHRGLSWYQLEQERTALRAEGERIYKQLFPQERRVPNPRSQLEAKVRALGGAGASGQLLPMMADLESAFAQLPEVRPTGIRFDGNRSEIRLQLTGKDFAQFERFKELASAHFNVESGAINNDQDGVSGVMTLRAKG